MNISREERKGEKDVSHQLAQKEKQILRVYYKMIFKFCSLKPSFCFNTKEKKITKQKTNPKPDLNQI